ncbi:hypothetical protein GLYMA_05G228050v4 [Glycine max]|nr:hypothetical protein GLYMA_05G228050v4 [Glycine max]KAH1135854.1 hypothetical protein GYH30_013525 [Glycine max]
MLCLWGFRWLFPVTGCIQHLVFCYDVCVQCADMISEFLAIKWSERIR